MKKKSLIVFGIVGYLLALVLCLYLGFIVLRGIERASALVEELPAIIAEKLDEDPWDVWGTDKWVDLSEQVGNQFLTALQRQEYASACTMVDPDLYGAETSSALREYLESHVFSIQKWQTIEQLEEGNHGEMTGVITDLDGDEWDYYLSLHLMDEQWLVTEFSFEFQE